MRRRAFRRGRARTPPNRREWESRFTLAALLIIAHLSRELGISVVDWVEEVTITHLRPMGVLYFVSAPRLEDALSRVLARHPLAARLVVHLDGLGRIDLSGALMLRAVVEDAEAAGLEVRFEDLPPRAVKIVGRVLGAERVAIA